MKYIKLYESYINETVLVSNTEFMDLIKSIDNSIAKYLVVLFNTDIKTNYNALKLSDKNDQVEFISNNQYIKLTNELDPETIFKRKGNSTSIGRLVRSILTDNDIKVTDKEIEEFVNQFKAKYDAKFNLKETIQEVSGEEIIKWYNESNYATVTKTELGNSCMRYNSCERFFGIYSENPDVCKLIIYLDVNKKLLARALFWKVEYSSKKYDYFLDRVYTTNSSDRNIITDWVKSKYSDKLIGSYYESNGSISVQLKTWSFDYYPYVDSLYYLYSSNGVLSNNGDGSVDIYILQNTDGTYDEQVTWCEFEDQTFPENECVYSEYHRVYIHQDNARYSKFDDENYWYEEVEYSKYLDDYLLKEKACWSKHLNDWLSNDSYFVYLNKRKTDSDYYPEDELNDEFAEESNSGEFFIISLLTECDGDYYFTDDLTKVYMVNCELETGEVIEYMTENDAKLFGKELGDDILLPYEEYSKQLFTNMIYDNIISYLSTIRSKYKEDFINRLNDYNTKNGVISKDYKDKNYHNHNFIYTYYESMDDAKDKIYEQITKMVLDTVSSTVKTYPSDLQKEVVDNKDLLVKIVYYTLVFDICRVDYHLKKHMTDVLLDKRSQDFRFYVYRLAEITKSTLERMDSEPNIIESIKAIS